MAYGHSEPDTEVIPTGISFILPARSGSGSFWISYKGAKDKKYFVLASSSASWNHISGFASKTSTKAFI